MRRNRRLLRDVLLSLGTIMLLCQNWKDNTFTSNFNKYGSSDNFLIYEYTREIGSKRQNYTTWLTNSSVSVDSAQKAAGSAVTWRSWQSSSAQQSSGALHQAWKPPGCTLGCVGIILHLRCTRGSSTRGEMQLFQQQNTLKSGCWYLLKASLSTLFLQLR